MKCGAYDYIRKEHIDLTHLGIVINSTHERRQLRIARALEEERTREIDLNLKATDKVRDMMNILMPKLNASLAGINSDLDMQSEHLFLQLTESQQREFKQLFHQIKTETAVLEATVRGLLKLYQMLYAHHTGAEDLDRLKQEMEAIAMPS